MQQTTDTSSPSNYGRSQIGRLLERLDREIAQNAKMVGYIDQLQFLVSKREDSALKGLKEKLEAVGRGSELRNAERDLVNFEMMLDRLTHFESAQRIFLFFLMRILHVFEAHIMPDSLVLSRSDVEEIIEDKIISPTLSDIDGTGGHDLVFVSHSEIKGMINWLAERCHIRWQSC